MDGTKLSIIIPAYNEEEKIVEAIARIRKLQESEYQNLEIIVAVNGSTDGTFALAQKFADKAVKTAKKGLSLARNMGADVASGDIFIFLDVDTRLLPGALVRFARDVRENSVGSCSAYAKQRTIKAILTVWIKNFVRGTGIIKGLSGPIFCHRSIFVDHKIRFREDLNIAEIHDFMYRARKQAGARYTYFWGRYYLFSVNRYERIGYGKTLRFWIRYWIFSHKLGRDHRVFEEEYWSQ